ncbi:S16 family serine protease, partial [Thiolapillus sp.]
AAARGGIKTVIIPEENERDLKEMPANITRSLDIRPVKWIDEVLEIALLEQPAPREKIKAAATAASAKAGAGKKPRGKRLTTH